MLRMKSLLQGILMPYEACQIPQEKREKRAFHRTAMDDTRSAVGSPILQIVRVPLSRGQVIRDLHPMPLNLVVSKRERSPLPWIW